MAWAAVDRNGEEVMFNLHPTREEGYFWYTHSDPYGRIFLPKGSIKKLIGRDLTWEDKPFELKE